MRRAAKIDGNHNDLVDIARQVGATVQSLAPLGKGCPDLLIGFRGSNWLVEVKDPRQDPCKRRLTPDEKTWHDGWKGQVAVVETSDELLSLLTERRKNG